MFLARSVRYLALLILGGLLTPVEFGVFAALFVVVDGLALLQGFGIGHALIYRRRETDAAADTSFLLSVWIGAFLVVVAWFVAPLVSRFYGDDSMTPLFRVASFVLVIHGFRLVPYRLFEKALDFKKKLGPALAGSLAYLVVSIALALHGAGAWSLVWASVASVLSETIAYWVVSPWRPRLRFSPRLAREDLSFGWVVVGGSVLIFAFRNVDRVVISRLVSTAALGAYAFAYSLANLPATLFVRILNTVLFPSYSSLGENRVQQRDLFLRATSFMSAAGLLYTTLAVFFGPRFLVAMYDQKWIAAAVPLAVLAFFALFRSLSALVGDLLVATGHPRVFRAIMGFQLALAAVGLYFGAKRGGTVGVAFVMTGAQLASLIAGWVAAGRITGAGARELGAALRWPLTAGVVSAVASAAITRVLSLNGSLLGLVAAVIVVVVVFIASWAALDAEFRSEAAKALGRGKPA
jgi:O-antigen/teichoic acid export membrane protein